MEPDVLLAKFGLEPRRKGRRIVNWQEVAEWLLSTGCVISFTELAHYIKERYKKAVKFSELDRAVKMWKKNLDGLIVIDGIKKTDRRRRYVGIFKPEAVQ